MAWIKHEETLCEGAGYAGDQENDNGFVEHKARVTFGRETQLFGDQLRWCFGNTTVFASTCDVENKLSFRLFYLFFYF